jgi:hypothetical protein
VLDLIFNNLKEFRRRALEVLMRIWELFEACLGGLFRKPNFAPSKEKRKGKEKKRKPAKKQWRKQTLKFLRTTSRKIPGWAKGTVVGATLLITLLQAYPWLSVEKDSLLDPYNPYSQFFVISNSGYIPVIDLSAECYVNFDFSNGPGYVHGARFLIEHFAGYLGHEGKATLPCFRTIGGDVRIKPGGEFAITVTYAFPAANFPILRRSQTFKFVAVFSPRGEIQWEYVG